ncbi:MAG: pantetheine-phosphate adenylyltransferase [Ruminococcus sp.]|nr:pantetheine-phosphate adenylyltransferase [Ruminococcus sp.]
MRIAVCPGSFDPVTLGHLDIIERASSLFDKVIVLVSFNAHKNKAVFTVNERMEMLQKVTTHLDNVVVDCYSGLLADYLKMTGACAIVKGLRAVSDFEYEFQMALVNKKLYSGAETVFLTTREANLYLSSSLVKELAAFGGDISGLVSPQVHDFINERLTKKEK